MYQPHLFSSFPLALCNVPFDDIAPAERVLIILGLFDGRGKRDVDATAFAAQAQLVAKSSSHLCGHLPSRSAALRFWANSSRLLAGLVVSAVLLASLSSLIFLEWVALL